MKVEMNINADICGENSIRFASAVQAAVAAEYPEATVSVALTNAAGGVNVTGTETHNCVDTWDVIERIGEIANDVWAAAAY